MCQYKKITVIPKRIREDYPSKEDGNNEDRQVDDDAEAFHLPQV
jgi:hypothetical protein